jgi:hypothetical protein
MATKRVVLGIVDTPAHADITVRRLVSLGFPSSSISVLFPDRHGDHDFAFEAATKAPEGALAGIGFGAVLGAIVGLALGIAGYADAALAPILHISEELGPLVPAMFGLILGSIVFGLLGALFGSRIPEIEAKHYEGKIRVGTILVGVHAEGRDNVRLAREVLRSVAASDVQSTTESALPLSST